MIASFEDQAAGLRRLFRRAPPVVAALYATGEHARGNALRLAERLAGGASNVIVLDEAAGPESLVAAREAGTAPARDLLQAVDGRVRTHALCASVGGGVFHVPARAAAMALPLLDDERRARLLAAMTELHRRAGFVLVHARDSLQPSPFVQAAPRCVVLAEASRRGAEESCARIKELAGAGAGAIHLAVARAQDGRDARRFFTELAKLVASRVGVPLAWLGEVEHDDLGSGLAAASPSRSPRDSEAAFMRRLAAWCSANGANRSFSGGL
jgi:flagellar biosynthesis protein FlhG